jgi:hypothetical protein
MNAYLIFTRDGREQRQELLAPGLTIGRSPDCGLRLTDNRISTQHCRLSVSNGEWSVVDLKSQNLTFVNNEPVFQPRVLRDNDVLRLGRKEEPLFEAQFALQPVAPEPAPPKELAPSPELLTLQKQLAERDAQLLQLNAQLSEFRAQIAEQGVAIAGANASQRQAADELEGVRARLHAADLAHTECRNEFAALRGKYIALDTECAAHKQRSATQLEQCESRRQRAEHDLLVVRAELVIARDALAAARVDLESVRTAYNKLVAQITQTSNRE